jgi:hypothetical protein
MCLLWWSCPREEVRSPPPPAHPEPPGGQCLHQTLPDGVGHRLEYAYPGIPQGNIPLCASLSVMENTQNRGNSTTFRSFVNPAQDPYNPLTTPSPGSGLRRLPSVQVHRPWQ